MKTVLYVVLGSVAVFLLWAFTRTQSPDEQARWTMRSAIAACWKDQQRKSLPPDQARFIAGACEKMEADFRAKYRQEP